MPEIISYIISLIIGYFIGSFPTAYLLVKWKTSLDLREKGSRNIGTMNAFEVTGSKSLGLIVLIIDILKGALAVSISMMIWTDQINLTIVAGLFSIIGHNYSVWLGFKGGRGLATTAGVMLILGWIFVAIWCVIWAISYIFSKNLHASNIIAILISPIAIAVMQDNIFYNLLPVSITHLELMFTSTVACVILLLGHSVPIKELWKTIIKGKSTCKEKIVND